MNKGMIMNVNRRSATIFTSDCRMVNVKFRPDMTRGQEYDLDRTERLNSASVSRRFIPALVAACLVLLLVGGVLFSGILPVPVYATLSIDVNPSLELSLNRDLAVIRVRAINEDAKQLLVSHDFTGLNWQEAVRQWTQILKAQNTLQVQNMLISAVMPQDAEQLRTQLVNLEGTANQGELSNIAVRVIYSSDKAVAGQAAQNGLSVGRQMLLNQAEVQQQNYDAASIAQAPLGELVGKLLVKGDRDQTRLTIRETSSLSEASGATETNRETNGSQESQHGSQGSQETNRETSCDPTGSQTGTMETNRETNRETSSSQSGPMETNRETSRETSQIAEPSGTAATSGSQQGPTAGAGHGG